MERMAVKLGSSGEWQQFGCGALHGPAAKPREAFGVRELAPAIERRGSSKAGASSRTPNASRLLWPHCSSLIAPTAPNHCQARRTHYYAAMRRLPSWTCLILVVAALPYVGSSQDARPFSIQEQEGAT